MIARTLAAALVAGFLSACVTTGLQAALTTPLIIEAERYETAEAAMPAPAGLPILRSHGIDAHADAAHQDAGLAAPAGLPIVLAHGVEPHAGAADHHTAPASDLARTAFTGLATLIGGIGYALMLAAVMLVLRVEPSLSRAVPWAIGAFAAMNLAPALGLPPELPGMGGGDVTARQVWWLMAAGGTGLGLALIAIKRTPLAIGLGLVAILAPQVIGAPAVGPVATGVPAELAARFAARSLAVAFVFWLSLGLALGWAWERFGRRVEPAAA